MKRIKKEYFIALILVLTISFILIFINHKYDYVGLETSNLIVATLSFCISIFSLGLATMKRPQFNGSVRSWLIREPGEQKINIDAGYHLVYFEVRNKDDETINDFKFSFRGVKTLIKPPKNNINNYKTFEFSDSIIYSCSAIEVLPQKSSIKFGVLFKEEEWQARHNLTIVISGSNIESQSFQLHKSYKEMFDGFSASNPIKLKQILSRKEKKRNSERFKSLKYA